MLILQNRVQLGTTSLFRLPGDAVDEPNPAAPLCNFSYITEQHEKCEQQGDDQRPCTTIDWLLRLQREHTAGYL